jgi:uncharacterized membrane protein YadS
MPMLDMLRREFRVAFSTKAQSIRFRAIKWIVIAVAAWLLWDWEWSAHLFIAAILLGFALHLFWRFKTKGWTQPWGGWNDMN